MTLNREDRIRLIGPLALFSATYVVLAKNRAKSSPRFMGSQANGGLPRALRQQSHSLQEWKGASSCPRALTASQDNDVRQSGLDHVVFDGEAHQLADRMRSELAHDIGAVCFCGFDADSEGARYFFAALAFG